VRFEARARRCRRVQLSWSSWCADQLYAGRQRTATETYKTCLSGRHRRPPQCPRRFRRCGHRQTPQRRFRRYQGVSSEQITLHLQLEQVVGRREARWRW
jgi:hypothetical protein